MRRLLNRMPFSRFRLGLFALLGVALLSDLLSMAAQAQSDAGRSTAAATDNAAPAPATQASNPFEQPALSGAAAAGSAQPETAAAKLRFNFRYQPWPDVLDWFAEQADLSLVMDAPPAGTFNYTDSRQYTPAEAIDLLNSVLLTKGYTLVVRERLLMLVNLEDGVPPNLVPYIPLEKLDDKGEFELVTVLFQVQRMSAEELEADLKKLIGPQGSVVVLPKAGLVQITETAGRLRKIRSFLEAAENPESASASALRVFEVQHAFETDVLTIIRQLLDIPEDAFASADGSVRIAFDPTSGKLFVTGRPEKIARVEEILKVIDVPLAAGPEGTPAVERPQLEVYSVVGVDPATVLAVLQTILAEQPDVRLTVDPINGSLIALARPSEHRTIQATIDQMQSTSQTLAGGLGSTGNVRLVPLTGSAARTVLEQLEAIWPATRPNKIRVMTPQPTVPQRRGKLPADEAEPAAGDGASRSETRRPGDRETRSGRVRAVYVNQRGGQEESDASSEVVSEKGATAGESENPMEANGIEDSAGDLASGEGAPIIVIPGPNGLVIASDDTEALDEFEALLRTLTGSTIVGGEQYSIFYLANANCTTVAESLARILGGRTATTVTAASGAVGPTDAPLSAASSATSVWTGAAMIVPDTRLNALIVQASPADLESIEQLLQILDQPEVPENQVVARPRMIPVVNITAAQAAQIVREVYQEYLVGGGGGRGQQPSPEDIFRMLREGGGGGGGGGNQGGGSRSAETRPKLALSIDTRTNSLIVSAPQPLFEEIRELVETIDTQTPESGQAIRVVTLSRSNAPAMQKALAAITGGKVTTQTTPTESQPQPTAATPTPSQTQQPRPDEAQQEEFRRRMEFFNRLRGGGEGEEGGRRRGRGGFGGGRGD